MNRVMIEFLLIDDECLARDPILRPYLLQMRMKQLEELNGVALEEPPFSLFGESVGDDVSYTIILEIIDMWNTLGVYGTNDEVVSNRLYRQFMNRCIDCAYWNYYT